MTPRALNIYKEQQEDREREVAVMQDISAWMNGLYVLKAIGCVLSKKASYPEKHPRQSGAIFGGADRGRTGRDH